MGEIFERRSPEIPLEWTGERLTSAVSGQVEIEHLHRYFLARQLSRGKDVLDVASGEGYGSALLAQVAYSVVGIELDQTAVDHANTGYNAPNLRYIQGDARELPVSDACADVVVSFETLEHIYDHDRFLREVKRVLRPGGLFIVSSPNRDVYSPANSAANPYHARELTPSEFADVLGRFFAHVRLLFQRPLVGSALVSGDAKPEWMTFERRGASHFEGSAGVPRSPYVVAVASDSEMPAAPDSIYIHTDEVGLTLSHADAYRTMVDEVVRMRQRAEAAEVALNQLNAVHQNSDAIIASLRNDLFAAGERAAVAAAQHEAQLGSTRDQHAQIEMELRAAKERLLESEDLKHQLAQARAQEKLFHLGLRRVVERNLVQHRWTQLAQDRASLELKRELQQARVQRDVARVGLARLGAGDAWRPRLQHAEARAKEAERIAVEWRRLHDRIVERLNALGFKWLPKRFQRRFLVGKH